jgi:hypothetical protein
MAGGIGALTVSLGLDAADYVNGLAKAEKQAKNSSDNIVLSFKSVAQGVGVAFAALNTAGVAAFAAINNEARNIADFQDFAEKVGDTASQFSSLQLAADVSTTSLETIAAASIKLSVGLSKVNDESKGAGKALSAIGIDLEEFKNLSPVEQIDAVSKALAGFEDGAGKTAVAVALFGKAGAEILPFMNDLAEQGERQIRLTDEQIKAADDYVKAQDRLKSEFSAAGAAMAADLIPSLAEFQDIAIAVIGSLGKSEAATTVLKTALGFLGDTLKQIATAGAIVNYVFQAVGNAIGFAAAAAVSLANGDVSGIGVQFEALQEDAQKLNQEFSDFQDRIDGINKTSITPEVLEKPKKELEFSTETKKQTQETNQRAIDLAKTYADLFTQTEKLLAPEKSQIDLLKESIDNFTQINPAIREYLNTQIELAKTIENEKADQAAFNIGLENEAESFNAAEEAANSYNETLSNAYTSTFDKLQTENEDLTISLIRNDKERAKAQLAIENQRRVDTIYSLNLEQETRDDLLKQEEANAELRLKALDNTKDGFAELQNSIEGFSRDSAQAIVDFTFGAESSFKGFVDGLLKQFARLAIQKSITDPLFNSLSSSFEGSGGAGIFGSLFSGLGFANGGSPPVGKASLVGERGAELFVPKTAGTIIPNGGLGGSQTNNVSITINQDGSSNQQGNPNQLAKQLEAAVVGVLLKQKRQAGILA